MKLKKIIDELSLHRIITIFFTLCVMAIVSFAIPGENLSINRIFESPVETIEKIDIIQLLFIYPIVRCIINIS